MKVVYFGYYATFAAFLMAAIHTGIYAGNKLPPYDWIMAHFKACALYRMQFGNLMYIGIDEQLREIYLIGCRRHSKVIKLAMASVSDLYGIKEHLHFVDARKAEGIIPRVVSLFLLYYPYCYICIDLFSFWFRRKYESCAKMVEAQKELLNTIPE